MENEKTKQPIEWLKWDNVSPCFPLMKVILCGLVALGLFAVVALFAAHHYSAPTLTASTGEAITYPPPEADQATATSGAAADKTSTGLKEVSQQDLPNSMSSRLPKYLNIDDFDAPAIDPATGLAIIEGAHYNGTTDTSGGRPQLPSDQDGAQGKTPAPPAGGAGKPASRFLGTCHESGGLQVCVLKCSREVDTSIECEGYAFSTDIEPEAEFAFLDGSFASGRGVAIDNDGRPSRIAFPNTNIGSNTNSGARYHKWTFHRDMHPDTGPELHPHSQEVGIAFSFADASGGTSKSVHVILNVRWKGVRGPVELPGIIPIS